MAKINGLITALIVCTIWFSGTETHASVRRPASTPLMQTELREVFFENSKPSRKKIEKYLQELQLRRSELIQVLSKEGELLKGQDPKKAQQKAVEKKKIQALDTAIEALQEQISNLEKLDLNKLELAFRISEALKVDIENAHNIEYGLDYLGARLGLVQTSGEFSDTPEAQNLKNKDGSLLTANQLQLLKAQGQDLSRLDPKEDNFLWQHPARGGSQFYNSFDLSFPEKAEGQFEEMINAQTKPKMEVKVQLPDGSKEKFKLKVGRELHSEPTAAALAQKLGFHTDKSKRYSNFKVQLGKLSYKEFKVLWNEYYEGKELDLMISQRARDDKGREYIVFPEVILEHRVSDDVVRLGPFSWRDPELQSRREFRALAMFQIWIQNSDLKNENTKILLNRQKGAEQPLAAMVHDLGLSFGDLFAESPLSLDADPIFRMTNDKIVYSFRPNAEFDFVTWSDARWFLRLLATLSVKDIEAAIALGKWPDQAPHKIAQHLTYKLVSRRNAMMKHFKLLGEEDRNGNAIQILSAPLPSKEETLPLTGRSDHVADFERETTDRILKPLLKNLGEGLVDLSYSLPGAIEKVSIEPEWFGFDNGLIAEVLLSAGRKFTRTERPEKLNETYLVRDDFVLGLRLGAGLVVSGDVSLVKKHILISPVESRKEMLQIPRLIISPKEDYAQYSKRFPKNHIHVVEYALKGRGRIKTDVLWGPGASLERDAGPILRVVSVVKDSKIERVWVDGELSSSQIARFYTQLGLFKINHVQHLMKESITKRRWYSFENIALNDQLQIMNDVAKLGNTAGLEKLKLSRMDKRLANESRMSWSVLGMLGSSRRTVNDSIETYVLDQHGKEQLFERSKSRKVQFESRWKFLTDGEESSHSIAYQVLNASDRNLEMRFSIHDLDLKHRELNKVFLSSIDLLSARKRFVDFSPDIHSKGKTWGELELMARMVLSEKGIRRLMELDSSKAMDQLSRLTGIPQAELSRDYLEFRKSDLRGNFHTNPQSRNRLRHTKLNVLGHTLDSRDVYFRLETFLSQRPKSLDEASKLPTALYASMKGFTGAFTPIVVTLALQDLPEADYYVSAHIAPPAFTENKLPLEVVFINQAGKLPGQQSYDQHLYDFEETSRLYEGLF